MRAGGRRSTRFAAAASPRRCCPSSRPSFLTGRTVSLTLAGAVVDMAVEMGLPQGSSLSPMLWLYFNADYIDAMKTSWA